MTNWKTKKLMVSGILVILFLSAAMPSPTQAQTNSNNSGGSLLSCVFGSNSLVYCALYFVTYAAGTITSWFVSLGAWLTQFALSLTPGLINSTAVTTGFGVTLALANLGFVLAIIIIAIATILRSQTYGVKQILWKLVVAAIFVNFSLVIAGSIVGFSDSLTTFFMKPFPGSGSDANGAFVNQLVIGFKPQVLLSRSSSTTPSSLASSIGSKLTTASVVGTCAATWWLGLAAGPVGVAGVCAGTAAIGAASTALVNYFTNVDKNQGDKFFQNLLGLVFVIVFNAIIALTFMALAVMLFIRYIYLGILLIIMPLVWLLWIFPKFKSHWDKWWSNFIRWTFFAPTVVFFLYLAIAVSQSRSGNVAAHVKEAVNAPAISLAQQSGQDLGFIQSLGDIILLTGLSLGGLVAANALSVAGAGVTMGLAKSAGGAIQGFAFKQGKIGGRAALRAAGERKFGEGQRGIIDRLRESRLRPLAATGRMLAGIGTNEEYVRQAAKNVPDNPEERRKNLRGSMKKEAIFANLAAQVRDEELKETDTIGNQTAKDWIDSHQRDFTAYGQGKLSSDINKAFGGDKTMRDSERAMAKAEREGRNPMTAEIRDATGATVRAFDALNKATKEFVEKLNKSDVAKMNMNEVFSPTASQRMAQVLAKQLAVYAQQLVPNMLNKMKSPTLKNFNVVYKAEIDKELDNIENTTAPGSTEQQERLNRMAFAADAFDRAFANNAFGFSSTGGGATTPSATGPANTTNP
ncbi:MAG: hypothetical protein HY434_02355 [Candidatus Liptonbacteria bacterium]|nr:hypothetical protein [Candidatus Liptonbacteria bacterium]